MKPTEEQVKSEIEKLKEMKPNVRKFSGFGDNHHAAIDAQIRVLEERMSDDDIYSEWEDADDYERNRNIIDSALEAVQWRDDEGQDEPPSKGWESLLQS